MRSGAPAATSQGRNGNERPARGPGRSACPSVQSYEKPEPVERADALVPRQPQVVMAIAADGPAEQAREHGALAREQGLIGLARVARVQPDLEPELVQLGHEPWAARGVGLGRCAVVRVAVRGEHEARGAVAVRALELREAAVRPVGVAAAQAVQRREREPGGLEAGLRRVAGEERALEARAGAEQAAPAPAPGRVDVVRERDREARAARVGGSRLGARRRGSQREHELVERRGTRGERRRRGAEAAVLVDRGADLLLAREQRCGAREIPRRVELQRRPVLADEQPGGCAQLRRDPASLVGEAVGERHDGAGHPSILDGRPRRGRAGDGTSYPCGVRPTPALAYRASIAAACVVAALRLLPFLGDRVMHRDEALAVMVARRPLGELLETVQLVRGGAPLHFLLAKLVAELGGGLVATRAISALGLVLAIVAVGLLGRALAGPVVGVAAAWILALSPVALYYGDFARMYSLFLAFSALALWCLVRALETGETRYWGGTAAFLVVTTYTHPYGVVVGLVAALAVLADLLQLR